MTFWARALPYVGCVLLAGLAGCTPIPAAGTPRFQAVSVQQGDSVKIDDSTDHVVIDVASERGIGNAEIVRVGKPPKTLTVNLHLKGMEEFDLGWGDTLVAAHVTPGDGSVHEEATLSGGQAQPIDNTSSYWMPVSIEATDPTIPLQSGFFAAGAAPAFLDAAPERFSLKWIDFYR